MYSDKMNKAMGLSVTRPAPSKMPLDAKKSYGGAWPNGSELASKVKGTSAKTHGNIGPLKSKVTSDSIKERSTSKIF